MKPPFKQVYILVISYCPEFSAQKGIYRKEARIFQASRKINQKRRSRSPSAQHYRHRVQTFPSSS